MEQYIRRIREVFKAEYFTIKEVYELEDQYLFFIVSNGDKDKVDIQDPWYTVDKKTKKIAGFVVHQNLDLFSRAMKMEPVYTE